jgi:hypothetical protein
MGLVAPEGGFWTPGVDVLINIDEDLIKTFQIALVFLNVAFWNWLYGSDSDIVWD